MAFQFVIYFNSHRKRGIIGVMYCIEWMFISIAKRTKSKNRMQIIEFPERLSHHKRVLREIQGM